MVQFSSSPRYFPDRSLFLISLAVFFSFHFFWALPQAFPAQITLQWDPNTDSNLAGYKIHYGTASRSYQYQVDVGRQTTCTIPNLDNGKTFYMAATAYDKAGNESAYSNEISCTTPAASPVTSCNFAISPPSQAFSASGGTGVIQVTSSSSCQWTAVSNVSWLIVTSNSVRTGNGAVNFSVAKNSSTSTRSGTLAIAGKIFAVIQAGSSGGTSGSPGGASSYSLTLAQSGNGSGTVTANPAGTTFQPGTVVSVKATPATGSTFSGWSGGCTGTSPTCLLSMNANTTVTALFTRTVYLISANTVSSGTLSPNGWVLVNYGGSQIFSITPNSGYRILDVKVDGISKGALKSYTFSNVTANHTIQASFSPITARIFLTRAG